jgi:ABC-type transport system substrate-binding protein
LEFNLEKPDKTFLNTIALPSASAVPRKAVEEAGADFASRPVGSGQFVLDEYEPGSRLVLTRNPDYFDERTAAGLDKIDFTLGIEPHTGLLRVQQGQSEVLGDTIPSADFNSVKNDPRYEEYVHHATSNAITYLYMNTEVEPWNNGTVREAMQYAIDKERVIQVSNNGRGRVAGQILPPNMPGHDPSIGEAPHDPEKAKQLLEEAGYPDGFEATFWSDNSPDSVKAAQVIQQDLAEVGVDAEIRSASFEEYLSSTSSGRTDAGMAGWFADFPDPSTFLNVLFDSAQIPANNLAKYSNPEVDEKLARARYVQDAEERLTLYREIQKQILADHPWVPIFYHVNYYFVSPRVGGYVIHPVWGGGTYADWYLTE